MRIQRSVKRLFLSRCHTIELGVKKIKECQIPSTIGILMEMRSSGTLSNIVSSVVKDLIDQEDYSILIPATQKSAIEKPANNPCKSLPNVAGQDTIRSFQAELSNQNSLARAQRLNLVLLRSGDNKTNIKVPVVSQPV